MSAATNGPAYVQPAFYTAAEVAEILRLARPTVYEIAREDPLRLGAETFGRRCVRFRRSTIDALAGSPEAS